MKNSNYISIRQYLGNKGINPAKDRGYYGMYYSPLREDTNPSFKVDYEKVLWHDFGTGEGGSIIDLVMRLENCSLAEAFQRLEDNSFSFHRDNIITPTIPAVQESAIKIQKTLPITHSALLNYLTKQRCINIGIAKCYCSEVHYSVIGKSYFAIGFKNDTEGWEIRSQGFQGTVSPKNITTINNGSNTVMVFEGFTDFLSYLMLKQNPVPTIDTVILNSTANLSKAIPFLQSHRTVHTFLDNDEAGRESLSNLHDLLTSSEVVDHSAFYKNYKDLNEYWQANHNLKNKVAETKAAPTIKQQIPMKKKGRSMR